MFLSTCVYDVTCLALTLERPADVQYKVDTATVTFQPPDGSSGMAVCLLVRLLSASSPAWTSQLHCDDATVHAGSVQLHDDDLHDDVQAVEVAFCVRRRHDVCSLAQNATIGSHCFIEPLDKTIFTRCCLSVPVLSHFSVM